MAVSASPATATWYEASSDHFVIYADDSERDVLRFAEYLERYHSAMERITGRKIEKPSPSNRVTIFVVGSDRAIRKLVGDKDSNIAGFYVPRAGGSVAFVQDIKLQSGYPHFSTVILLHEYAHHFFISSSRTAMPRWMNEGAAEFFAAAGFPSDGGVQVGRPAKHRAADLFYSQEVSIQELFDDELYRSKKRYKYDAYYGRSWLLYHYLMFSVERAGQLTKYWASIHKGTSSVEAAKATFGDLDQLDKELDKYLSGRKLQELRLPASWIEIGPVSLRELSAGEAAAMPLVIRSKRGVDEEQAAKLVVETRELGARFPNDPAVLAALAEAEHDSGNHDAAIAAAERAVALNPNAKNAYVQMGYALFAKAEDAEDEGAAYKAAMVPFSKLNALENDHPIPLIYYYRSYAQRGARPPENARNALERASVLAPFDHGLAMNVATMMASEGRIELSRYMLRPLAANPHGGGMASYAQQMMDAMKDAPEGEPFYANFIATEKVEVDLADDDEG